jgi:hypothetical protein
MRTITVVTSQEQAITRAGSHRASHAPILTGEVTR